MLIIPSIEVLVTTTKEEDE